MNIASAAQGLIEADGFEVESLTTYPMGALTKIDGICWKDGRKYLIGGACEPDGSDLEAGVLILSLRDDEVFGGL